MKLLFGLLFFISLSGDCLSQKVIKMAVQKEDLKFLEKSELSNTKHYYGQHILIKELSIEGSYGEKMARYDDRDLMQKLGFTRKMKIEVLRELLSFKGDTTASNKYYFIRVKKPNSNEYSARWVIPEFQNFTLEVEALFSFTRLLTIGLPPIQPVLIDRRTGEKLNGNRERLNEVFSIYQKWFKDNLKNNFVGYRMPLEETSFCWLDDDGYPEKYMAEKLWQ